MDQKENAVRIIFDRVDFHGTLLLLAAAVVVFASSRGIFVSHPPADQLLLGSAKRKKKKKKKLRQQRDPDEPRHNNGGYGSGVVRAIVDARGLSWDERPHHGRFERPRPSTRCDVGPTMSSPDAHLVGATISRLGTSGGSVSSSSSFVRIVASIDRAHCPVRLGRSGIGGQSWSKSYGAV